MEEEHTPLHKETEGLIEVHEASHDWEEEYDEWSQENSLGVI